ncbi:hypothetical protein H9X88_21340 [Aeromonas hydrophila]|uniref:hypothetical protein n=1 Tax=Aeromonas hydrophila TaxID=644 RepID=UPI001B3A2B92|nr:hypothetical protein [Aeromonas hydrophila]MBQ4675555.1 hypothetical protein [Aeromonas hydrophila]MBW3814686.1 hypothetical protein [Aeromonas hydrophila]MCF7680615.1 hypothetical protein [Aeromonas hydrophila]MCF7693523.1 hypothetical protein [Aeromonas hydrophila]MCF7774394.1 hypothetical protein [Aeromonas hydrophila]
MTTTPSSDVVVLHQGSLQQDQRAADPLTLFLANELFPMMLAFWPASANQLDSNAAGTAKAWALTIKGFPVGLVREAVLQLADEVDRQFAPRPAEVKALMASMMQAAQPTAPTGQTISIRACEMIAEVRVLKRERTACADLVAAELSSLQNELRQRGVTVTGRVA